METEAGTSVTPHQNSNPDNTVSILLGVSSAGSPWIIEIDYAVTSQILLPRAWPHLCVTIHGQACLGAPQPVTVARGQPLRTNLQGQQARERGEWKKIFHVDCREWRRAASHTRAKCFSCFLSLSISTWPLRSSSLGDIHLNQVLTTSSLRTDSETPWRPDHHFFFLSSILAVSWWPHISITLKYLRKIEKEHEVMFVLSYLRAIKRFNECWLLEMLKLYN